MEYTMETTQTPYTKSLSHRGFIQGCTLTSKATNAALCHFFGGLRYALPPSERWRKALKLPESYTYGTRDHPGKHEGGAGVCPQPGFRGPADESAWSEDCFQCNVWVPIGEPPKKGWPVLIYIHGGWLQWGTPNTFSVASLLGETDFKAIIIMPAYRLNLFGFLYSSELEQDAASAGETPGNHGFWDQRLALEWAKETAPLFGGNKENITISGYSAGAYSVFHQLAYDLRLPASESIIKQAVIWSNGPGVQPKSPTEAQTQFAQLLSALNISLSLPWQEKLSVLRSLPAKTLLNASSTIQIHQFRPTTDSAFICPSLFTSLDNGTFATALKERNIRLLLGECRDEHFLYGIWHPPLQDTIQSLHSRLLADYPRSTVDALLPLYYYSQEGKKWKLPENCRNWNSDAFGKIYADMQVHTLQRGLIHSISSPSASGAGNVHVPIYRYKISYRATCVDTFFPLEWGVTHATDMALWFFGNGNVLSEKEKDVVWKGLLAPFKRFVEGEKDIGWGTTRDGDVREVRVLKPDGEVQIERDESWDQAVGVWGVLRGVKDFGGVGARL